MSFKTKAKQLDTEDITDAITYVLNTNSTLRTNFIAAIQSYLPDKKVQASILDPNPGDFLIHKIEHVNPVGSGINTNVALKSDFSKVQIQSTLDFDIIRREVVSRLTKIYHTIIADTTTFTSSSLIGLDIIVLAKEGFELGSGTDADQYTFDSITGTITFNSLVLLGERLVIIAG